MNVKSLLLIIPFTIALMSCSQNKALPNNLDSDEAAQIAKLLDELSLAIQEHNPALSKRLSGGASEDEIQKLRDYLGVEHQTLEEWFKWQNTTVDSGAALLPLGDLLSISESIQNRNMLQDIPLVSSNIKHAFKILDDGSGDGFYIDVTKPEPLVFYVMIEDPHPEYYGSLSEFLGLLIKIQKSGIAVTLDNGVIDYDYDKYLAIKAESKNDIEEQ